MCSIWHWNQSVFKGESLLAMSCFQILKNYFSFFVGLRFYSLDPSLTKSSGTAKPLLTVNVQSLSNCFKWKALEVCDWRNKYYSIFKTYVAFIQIHKCDWDGQMINHWFLLAVPVSYQENQWWELWQSSTGRCRDVQYEQLNSWCYDIRTTEGQWRRINSLNMLLEVVKWLHPSVDTFTTWLNQALYWCGSIWNHAQ